MPGRAGLQRRGFSDACKMRRDLTAPPDHTPHRHTHTHHRHSHILCSGRRSMHRKMSVQGHMLHLHQGGNLVLWPHFRKLLSRAQPSMCNQRFVHRKKLCGARNKGRTVSGGTRPLVLFRVKSEGCFRCWDVLYHCRLRPRLLSSIHCRRL